MNLRIYIYALFHFYLVLRYIKGCFDWTSCRNVPYCFSDYQTCRQRPSWCLGSTGHSDNRLVHLWIHCFRHWSAQTWVDC